MACVLSACVAATGEAAGGSGHPADPATAPPEAEVHILHLIAGVAYRFNLHPSTGEVLPPEVSLRLIDRAGATVADARCGMPLAFIADRSGVYFLSVHGAGLGAFAISSYQERVRPR